MYVLINLITLTSVNNLAFLLEDQGHFDEKALRGYEKALGPDHTSTMQVSRALAYVIRKMNTRAIINQISK